MRAGESRRGGACRRLANERGFTYVALLAVVALLALGLAAYSVRVADQVQRERERQLLRIGLIYAKAIAAYYHGAPGNSATYPKELDDLLLDTRLLTTVRYLREPYTDPMVPGAPMGLVRAADGTIRGVFSTSTATPFTEQALDLGVAQLAPAKRYADWQFIPKVDQ